MEKYEPIGMEIIMFETRDVIITSPGDTETEEEPINGGK